LALIKTVDPEGRRAGRESKLNRAGIELSEPKIGVLADPDDVAPAQLDFHPPVRPRVELVADIEG